MLKEMLAAWNERLATRRKYRRLIEEIESLNARDLQELRADPIEMRRQAYISVYGHARS